MSAKTTTSPPTTAGSRKKNKNKGKPAAAPAQTPVVSRGPWAAKPKRQSFEAVDQFDDTMPHLGGDKLKSLLHERDHKDLFIDREMSWLEFNRRVLEEAGNHKNPLLERVKFLAIFSTNLDEFYMIRLAGILNQRDQGVTRPSLGGYAPDEELEEIDRLVLPMRERQWHLWSQEVLPELQRNRICIVKLVELSDTENEALSNFFRLSVLPVLTPLLVDPTHPFPFISNLSLNFAIILRREKDGISERSFARLKIPGSMKRFIKLDDDVLSNPMYFVPQSPVSSTGDTKEVNTRLILIEDVIRANLGMLFPGMIVEEAHLFRVTRDADVEIAEDEAGDLLETMEKATRQRRFGHVVRVVCEPGGQSVSQLLIDAFEIAPSQLQTLNFFGYPSLWEIALLPRPDLQYPTFMPRIPESIQRANGDVFAAMREGDVLLAHPYDSFNPVVSFFSQAARDPHVVAIKATLYRVGSNSPIVAALLEAAQNEIEVTVVVELKARFDEKSNIFWAKALESAGAHVLYGVKFLKVRKLRDHTHAKLGLIIRKENGAHGTVMRPYCHMSTGNYNHATARYYTDIGLFTAREDIGSDMIRLFNRLTAIAPATVYSRLLIAPEFLRLSFYRFIDREIEHQKAGRQGHIKFKCNSITDPAIITKLYEASHVGVKIELLVRGICCLRPGVKDISENITVSSIVGRFLEHARVLWLYNNGQPEVYIGSADAMGRNLDRRVEDFFPILDPNHRAWIEKWVFDLQLSDTENRRVLLSDGTWVRVLVEENAPKINAQEHAIQALARKNEDFVFKKHVDEETQMLKKLVKAATKKAHF